MDQARADYDLAIDKNPENADNYFNRGNVHLSEGEFDNAHMDFDTAIDKERLNAKYYHAKGLAFQAEVETMQKNQGPDYSPEELEEKTNSAIAFFGAAL